VLLAGLPLERYLEFPPRTRYVDHAPFSPPIFTGLILLISGILIPFSIRIVHHARKTRPAPVTRRPFPWWGWVALAMGLIWWILAWTRFPWFRGIQPYTFTPLWIAYIVVFNALAWRRAGRCLMLHKTRYFLALFPLSACFWWLFEFLNRFVQNWYYTGGGPYSAWEYFWRATLPFSTVLPAVLSTAALLATFPRLTSGLENYIRLPVFHPRWRAGIVLLLFAAGLTGIGIFPNLLYPLLWTAPLAILAALQALAGRRTLFDDLRQGDWRRLSRLAAAALVCGLFWEMWNHYSLAKWVYEIPFVDRFHLFAMPALGYSGYLPFGLECGLIADLVNPGIDEAPHTLTR
jgi:hypothetical protein